MKGKEERTPKDLSGLHLCTHEVHTFSHTCAYISLPDIYHTYNKAVEEVMVRKHVAKTQVLNYCVCAQARLHTHTGRGV